MSDDQLIEFETLARQVGRKKLPAAWREEILDVAVGASEVRVQGGESPFRAVHPREGAMGRLPGESPERRSEPSEFNSALEQRVRRAERRTVWSMAACVVVSLVLIALLFRPRAEQGMAQNRVEERPARPSILGSEEREREAASPRREEVGAFSGALAEAVPPPPVPPPTPVPLGPSEETAMERGDPVAQIEGNNGGLLIKEAAINDVFQMLAKRAGKQYFHNSKIAGPEYKLNGRLGGRDPLDEMEELAFQYGLTLHQKGETVYALSEEQLSQQPSQEWSYQLRYLRPTDVDQVKALIQPTLSPSGIVNYEPETKSLKIVDSAHHVERARSLLAAVDKGNPGVGIERKREPAVATANETPAENQPASTSPAIIGKHSDDSSWRDVQIQGSVFGGSVPTEGSNSLDLRANRKPIAAIDFGGQINHVGKPESTARPLDLVSGGKESGLEDVERPTLEGYASDDLVALSPKQAQGVARALEHGGLVAQTSNPTAVTRDFEQATISLIDRVPVITTTVNENEVSNQVTEEVRYSIDEKDLVGNPATTRELGVTVAVTPTLLPDGTIRMKMRPRSAQMVEEIIGQSGNRYPQVSETMIEQVARIPEGHSLILGGFYGQVKSKNANEVPLLGDIPEINLFFKDKEAAEEPTSLLLVATPTAINGQVVVETKILSVNSSAGEQTGVDWTAGLGEGGLPIEAIGSLNSLFGIEGAGEVASGSTAASDGSIVLAPEQTKGVLRALSNAGLVTQISNPTVITAPTNTAAIDETELGTQATERRLEALQALEKRAGDEPYSTFSLHVSDVSFKLAKAALARGEWPAAEQLRVEDFVNAFDYGDPAPTQQEKVACKLEQAAHPFMQQRNLLRVSMRTAALGRSAETPLRLTVLLDNSGSMERADRAASVRKAFQILASQLNPQDQVTLIGFSRTPRLLADRLPGDRVAELVDLIASTPSAGGTNLEQALALGIEKANEQMLEGGQNRIILLTDGAANLGNAQPDDLSKLVESMRQRGIAFDACGVGAEELNDVILESLARKGDGRYYVLDRPEDADEGFAAQIAGALRPAARNVKVQVKFNPNRVGRYKLYGFEKHLLNKEDFRDDSVDAAELAAEEAGNAIYQIEVLPEGTGQIGTVSVRFQDAETGRMIEREWTIPFEAGVSRLEDSTASLRLASGAALLGEKLKGSLTGDSVDWRRLGKLINSLSSGFPASERVRDLVEMANKARELKGE